MSIHLILVDAEIEALPPDAIFGPAPRICCMPGADRQRIRILDSYLHRDWMSSMPDRHRRGRPDIVHAFLTLALNSKQRVDGELDVLVHTRDNASIRFARKATVSNDYIKFLGTMTELFEHGTVGKGEERITLQKDRSLPELLESERLDTVLALSPIGKKQDLSALLSGLRGKEVGMLIGGFPEGDYRSPVYELADLLVSLGDELLTVPDVTAQVLAAIP
jgi:rRNA small subunit pseudouridine methyltransferase Nep1